jgi:hypothetical protein
MLRSQVKPGEKNESNRNPSRSILCNSFGKRTADESFFDEERKQQVERLDEVGQEAEGASTQ